MPALIICDAPGCEASAPAVVRSGRLGYPSGWYVPMGEDRIVVACCAEHLSVALRIKGEVT